MIRLNSIAVLCLLAVVSSCSRSIAEKPGVGDSIIDFKLNDLSGKPVGSADARKDKVLVLKFGATWCPYCNMQIADLQQVYKQYDTSKVAILDVDVGEAAAQVREHVANYRIAYPVVLDENGAIANRYNVHGIPVVIVVDKNGTVVYRGYYTKFEQLKRIIDKALRKPS